MSLKKLTSLTFLLIFTFSSLTPSFSIPPEDEKKNILAQRKTSDPVDKEKAPLSVQDIRRPAPDFWQSIPIEEFHQAPWQYQCLYVLYNLCCGCCRALG
jgi:hypothetical protein